MSDNEEADGIVERLVRQRQEKKRELEKHDQCQCTWQLVILIIQRAMSLYVETAVSSSEYESARDYNEFWDDEDREKCRQACAEYFLKRVFEVQPVKEEEKSE